MSPEEIRERYEQVLAEVGPGVRVVAATKYVAVDDMAALAEAGIGIVGENRAQDLAAKHAAYGDAFEWHFIGHLQSRKAALVSEIAQLVHSLDSLSAARRLTVPALVQVNLAGEGSKSGIAPRVARRVPLRVPGTRRRALDDAAARRRPERSRPYFKRLRELASEHGLAELSMGTSQDYRIAAEEGATLVRVGSRLWRG